MRPLQREEGLLTTIQSDFTPEIYNNSESISKAVFSARSQRYVLRSSSTETQALEAYKKKLKDHERCAESLKRLRFSLRTLEQDYDKSEEDIKALQSVGQIIGEVLKALDDERFIVKASSGPRYVVGCRATVPKDKLKNEDPGSASLQGSVVYQTRFRELREVIELPLLNPELFLRVGIKPTEGRPTLRPPWDRKNLTRKSSRQYSIH
ncbi:hypothetical protein H4Q26_018414 [Puccinia striiformis f. sp. tritici PST-130]|nr:hypothetical protein H4Q26_018414 [Puccinia striiformis f. sp. tritici PST-130]